MPVFDRPPNICAPSTRDKAGLFTWMLKIPRVGLQRIYSNLGPKTDAYLATDGWSLTGFNSYGGSSSAFSIALPFTPKSNSRVSEVRAAIQYNGSGVNQVNISIYSDDAGVPVTVLAGPVAVKNLPPFPSCCALAVADFSPLAVAAGTRYWVVAGALHRAREVTSWESGTGTTESSCLVEPME